METNKKILIIVAMMLIALAAATIINVALNFRTFSYNSAIDRSETIAVMVRDGLTAHMVNDVMDKRKFFLKNISNYDGVEALWIVRSPTVIKEYGPGMTRELPKDAIDKKVLKNGIAEKIITEDSNSAKLRVSIPYKANSFDTPDCLTCHHVNEGDTLGVISMEFDISETRNHGMMTIFKIFALNVVFIIIALFLTNHYFKPYMRIFSDLAEMIKKANHGDFSPRITRKISGDGAEVVNQINQLFSKMQGTFDELKSNLTTFVSRSNISTTDPLEESRQIIHELADVYKFKKTIELDPDKLSIYERVYYILTNKFGVENFSFYEVNKSTKERTLLYSTLEDPFCHHITLTNAQECRAVRTSADVVSTDFSNLCQNCDSNKSEYVCIPYNINEDVSLVISIYSEDKENLDNINKEISNIKSYLDAIKPVVESRILMEKLRDSSLRDGLTGLYNRRFLEEYITQEQAHILRENINYDIMMIDIDFFKLVNDNYGHDVGDTVIKALSEILLSSIRDSDMAIRYGGEEFLILLRRTTPEATLNIASLIHTGFRDRKFSVGNNENLQKTLSIGIAKLPEDGNSIWKVIKYADTALYSAKNNGRDKIVEFTSDMFEGY